MVDLRSIKNEGINPGWGLGTRLSEETDLRPKPMVEIGGRPILWHISKENIFVSWYKRFVVCCGYLGYVIKYFTNYFNHVRY